MVVNTRLQITLKKHHPLAVIGFEAWSAHVRWYTTYVKLIWLLLQQLTLSSTKWVCSDILEGILQPCIKISNFLGVILAFLLYSIASFGP